MIDKRIKLAIIASILASITLVTLGIITIIFRSGKTEVEIIAYPQNAKITINDQPSSTGTTFLEPGEYTFKASLSGWKDLSITKTISNEPTTITLLPDAETTEAYEWIESDVQGGLEAEAITGAQEQEKGYDLYEKNPIIFTLPYKGDSYEVTYNETDQSPSGIEILIIASTPEARASALESIRKLNYDPSKMYIRYIGFNNPLQEVAQ